MKIADSNVTIEQIGNITDTSSFKMKSSRKAFQILSDLYSDKALAIVRELGCNATDSMIVAGKKDQPFHIHLPNTLEPWVTIQDYGTGITHENIYSIYATYFESTKTNSNDQIGCLGLGSKSPFCYTDNFSVISITNGIKRTYNAYFGADGCPTIAMMNQTPTDEGSGLAVQIPVKQQDFSTFSLAVSKAFRFFDVKPIITGGTITWLNEKPMFEGEGWRSYEKFGYCEAFAIMGGVTYPIDIYKVDAKYHDLLRKGGLVLYFGMAEVDFTPSRESLSYCDQTITALNSKLDFVMQDFQARINEILASKDDILEALRMVVSLQKMFPYINGMSVNNGLMWRGIDVSDPTGYVRKLANPTNEPITFYKTSYYKQKISTSNQIDLGGMWVVVDEERGAIPRIREWCKTNPEKKLTKFSVIAQKTLVDKGFPADAFVSIQTLPKPQRTIRTRNGSIRTTNKRERGVFNVYEIGNTDNITWESSQIDSTIKDSNIPKYYIVKDNGWEFNLKVEGMKISSKKHLYDIIRFMGLTTSDVVMVGERNLKYMTDSIPFQEHIDNNFEYEFNADGIATAINSPYNLKGFVDHADYKALPNNEFKKHIDSVWNVVQKYNKYKYVSFLYYNKKEGKTLTYKGSCKVTQMLVDKMDNWRINEICLVANLLK